MSKLKIRKDQKIITTKGPLESMSARIGTNGNAVDVNARLRRYNGSPTGVTLSMAQTTGGTTRVYFPSGSIPQLAEFFTALNDEVNGVGSG